MAKIGNALWKSCAGGGVCVQLKATLKPLVAWFATFGGAVVGAAPGCNHGV